MPASRYVAQIELAPCEAASACMFLGHAKRNLFERIATVNKQPAVLDQRLP